MNEELTNILEGIETANNIQQYEEGLGDVAHKIGTGIKNFFGTKAGAAQRANADAQTAQQTAQNQAAANQANANIVSAQQAAQQILKTLQSDITKTKVGNVVKGAAGAVGKGLATAAEKTGKFVAGAVTAAGDAITNPNSNAITRKAAFQNGVEKTQNAIDNGAQKTKDLKNKVSNAAHGEAKTASEKENAKNQQNGGDE